MLDRFINWELLNVYNVIIVGLMLGIGGLMLMLATEGARELPLGTATTV